jgi:hypothetical protein
MIPRVLLISAALTLAAPAFAQTAYFAAIDDVPLPAGFAEIGGGWSFAGAAGRIVEARARGSAGGLAVRDFYDAALPPLGWSLSPQADGTLVFERGRESLSFTVVAEAGVTTLGVRLVTHPTPQD